MRSQKTQPQQVKVTDSKSSNYHHQNSNLKLKVFITGLSSQMTRRGLMDYFRSIYPSTINFNSQCLGSKHTKISGFGFLVLGSERDFKAALARRLFFYKGRNLKAEPYLRNKGLEKHKESMERKRVFVGRIPAAMNSDDLWSALEAHIGPVERAYVVSDYQCSENRHKGFGYASFSTPELAAKALKRGKLYLEVFKTELNFEKPQGKISLKNSRLKADFKLTNINSIKYKDRKTHKKSKNSKNRLGGDKRRSADTKPEYHHLNHHNYHHQNRKRKFQSHRPCSNWECQVLPPRIPILKRLGNTNISQMEMASRSYAEEEALNHQTIPSGIHHTYHQHQVNKFPQYQVAKRGGVKNNKNNYFCQNSGIFINKFPKKISQMPRNPKVRSSSSRHCFPIEKQQQNSKDLFGRLMMKLMPTNEQILDSQGWKRHSLQLLNHTTSNVQINRGGMSQSKTRFD